MSKRKRTLDDFFADSDDELSLSLSNDDSNVSQIIEQGLLTDNSFATLDAESDVFWTSTPINVNTNDLSTTQASSTQINDINISNSNIGLPSQVSNTQASSDNCSLISSNGPSNKINDIRIVESNFGTLTQASAESVRSERNSGTSQLASKSGPRPVIACDFCGSNYKYHQRHLDSSDDCREQFCQREGIPNNKQAISRHLQKSYPSRGKKPRKSYYQSQRANQTPLQSVNQYIKEIHNPKRIHSCNECKGMFTLKQCSKISGRQICTQCAKLTERNDSSEAANNPSYLRVVEVNETSFAIPELVPGQKLMNGQQTLLPYTYGSINKGDEFLELINQGSVLKEIHKKPTATNPSILPELCFGFQYKKLSDKKGFILHKGFVIDQDNRKVNIIRDIPVSQSQKGTEDYDLAYRSDIQSYMTTFGPYFLAANVRINPASPLAFLYKLKQENEKKVEVIFSSDNGDVLSPRISLFDDDGNSFSLETVFDAEDFRKSVILGDSTTSAASHVNENFGHTVRLVKQLFNSVHHTSRIFFTPSGDGCEIRFAIWPKSLEIYNKKLAMHDELTPIEKEEVLSWIDCTFSAHRDSRMMTDQFGLSKETAVQVQEMATKLINRCQLFQFPSRRSLWEESLNFLLTDVDEDVETQKYSNVKFLLSNLIKALYQPENPSNVDMLLEHLKQIISVRMSDNDTVEVTFQDEQPIILQMDAAWKRLHNEAHNDLFWSFYERIITFVPRAQIQSIILKRPYVKDVFLPFFSPFLMLATKTSNTVCLINKDYEEVATSLSLPNVTVPKELEAWEGTHRPVSLMEALFNVDPSKDIYLRSTGLEYVSTSIQTLRTFRRVTEETESAAPLSETNYTDVKTGKSYSQVVDLHSKYLDRIGNTKMPFSQFVSSYEVKRERTTTKEIDDGANDDDEPDEAGIIATSDDTVIGLPKIIETKSGQKLKRRKIPSVLKLNPCDTNSDEFLFSRVLLFSPHTSLEEIDEDKWTTLFNEKPQNEVLTGKGEPLTKLELTRLRVFPTMCDSYQPMMF